MLCEWLMGDDKFKFCFWELSGNFLKNILNLRLVVSVDVKPTDVECQLYILA